ncbi:2-oxo-4-hydroxy-4-carboxy-5-ureidoimidazoline decarboxylase [Granulibacter bethesdensis]|uniref:2-oxo-4-hydroxy-4-carboxy-5-ureidoimidazoline decarboxylase n=1 Tax=Granulibacter bethesdensis (strain ATCC BAA-1260 / CGDNIH1) TaxID=391165 RepID=Q0BSR2_GRABC|nr:Urate oxidase [Granulibacter bethesdensis CGDNIH1]APH51967.1 Urate oxidase [Granulibacter bethesdensis]APH64657.1 Urate oxidase [Granulibacter bethesdensis]
MDGNRQPCWPFSRNMPREEFMALLEGIYENSPWVAEHAWRTEPFEDIQSLHAALKQAVNGAEQPLQLSLIHAHPELAPDRAMQLTPASRSEQHAAGLDECDDARRHSLITLNRAYRERFGYPFIIAVRGHGPDSIIAAMKARLSRTKREERQEALDQINRIAWFRLNDRFGHSASRDQPIE